MRVVGSRGGVPKLKVLCAERDSRQPTAICKSKGFVSDVASFLTPFGVDLFTSPEIAPAISMVSDTLWRPTTQSLSKARCSVAADGVKNSCGLSVDRDVFICAAQEKLTGGRYRLCKPNACGKSLFRFGAVCPQAVRSGILNSKMLTVITGVKLNGVEQAEQTDTKNCSNGVCR